jgi:MFS family permease
VSAAVASPGERLPQNRNFLFLLGGQVASIFGDRLNYLAVLALVGAEAGVFRQRDAPFEISKLSLLLFLPSVLLGPFSGVLVDRWNTRRTLLVSDALRGVIIGTVPLFYPHWGGLAHAYIAVAMLSTINTFFLPSRSAILPQIVPRDSLLPANASLTTGAIIATIAGSVLGGILVSAGGWRAGLTLDSLSYFVSTVSFLLMSPRHFVERPPSERRETVRGALARESRRFPRELLEAWETVRTMRPLLLTLLALFLIVASGGIVITTGVVYIERVSGDVARGLGFLAGALSVGMILGSPLSHLLGTRIGERRLLSGALALSGGVVMLFSRAHTFVLMLAVFFIGGIFLAPVVITTETLQQKYCPPALRGRVFAMRDFANRLGFLVLAVPGGLLATRLPVEDVLGGAGAVLALAGLAMGFLWRGKEM